MDEKESLDEKLFYLSNRFSSCSEIVLKECLIQTNGNMRESSNRIMEYLLILYGIKNIFNVRKLNYICNEHEQKIFKKAYYKFLEFLKKGVYSNCYCMIELSPTQPKFVCKFIFNITI